MTNFIDVDENLWSKKILDILLTDRTTKKNIIWATNDYEYLGMKYEAHFPITSELITGKNSNVIMPRILKSKNNQLGRTKNKAEVFTPTWICNEQCNLVDNNWFSKEQVFNIVDISKKTWKSVENKIDFPVNDKNKTWKRYVDENRLEIACGEAPYLVSRYDTVLGNAIPIAERIGFLDRKLRVVCENAIDEDEWLKWSVRAFESVYGFEFQGDNLLLARENLLLTYIDYMEHHLKRIPTEKELEKIATIISWNLWQMDGLTQTIPYENSKSISEQLILFKFLEEPKEKKSIFCIIKDWRKKTNHRFIDLIEGDKYGK